MDWVSSLLLATVRLAIPVLLISLAELYGQRAGMVNIGLEGLAAIGALVGFLMCYITGSNWIGLLCGALAGLLVNMIYAFSTVTLCADHTVYGMAINIFAPALASFIYRIVFGTGSDLKQIITMASIIEKETDGGAKTPAQTPGGDSELWQALLGRVRKSNPLVYSALSQAVGGVLSGGSYTVTFPEGNDSKMNFCKKKQELIALELSALVQDKPTVLFQSGISTKSADEELEFRQKALDIFGSDAVKFT